MPDWQWATHEINAELQHPNKWTPSRELARRPGWNLVETSTGDRGVRAEPPLVSCGNAGHQMLGLALWLYRPSRIVLTGYDMQPTGGLVRWRGEHPQGVEKPARQGGRPGKFEKWRAAMATTVEPLREMGVEVINATRETALDCFPRADLDSLL